MFPGFSVGRRDRCPQDAGRFWCGRLSRQMDVARLSTTPFTEGLEDAKCVCSTRQWCAITTASQQTPGDKCGYALALSQLHRVAISGLSTLADMKGQQGPEPKDCMSKNPNRVTQKMAHFLTSIWRNRKIVLFLRTKSYWLLKFCYPNGMRDSVCSQLPR